MSNPVSKTKNRVWIIFNYSSLVLLLFMFYLGKYFLWPVPFILGTLGTFIIFLVSFAQAFFRTKTWKMVHTASPNLDERETQVVLRAVKSAYAIFTIISLIIIYVFAILGYHPIDVVLAGALLYLAHTLPAGITGWNEE